MILLRLLTTVAGGIFLLSSSGNLRSAEPFDPPPSQRATFNFNPGWRFIKQDVAKAEAPDFDDSSWEEVCTPHTFNDTDAFDEWTTGTGEKSQYRGPVCYRKHFKLAAEYEGRKVFLEFEGMRQWAVFFVNGKEVGTYRNGVSPFGIDITDFVQFGEKKNVLAVRLTNEEVWLEGSGVAFGDRPEEFMTSKADTRRAYQWAAAKFNPNFGGINRNVRLHVTGKIYQTLPLYDALGTVGTYVYANDISVENRTAEIAVESEVKNESGTDKTVMLSSVIVDGNGTARAEFDGETVLVANGQKAILRANGRLADVRLWDVADPYLYSVYTILKVDGETVDVRQTTTGFRKTEFRGGAGKGGVYLNDRFVYLTGYAQRSTNEWAAIGQAQPDWLQDYTMAAMRESKANHVRWMHIAPMRAAVNACDRFGIIEAVPAGDTNRDAVGRQWKHRLEAMRDTMIYLRNHPSILFWEAGNGGISAEHMREMRELRLKWDPHGGRAIGCRTLTDPESVRHAEYFGVMLGQEEAKDDRQDPSALFRAYSDERRDRAPFLETEDLREEAARRYWDKYSPPHYGFKQKEGDTWNFDSETFCLAAAKRYNEYLSNSIANADPKHAKWSGYASIIFSDTNSHGRQFGSEVCRVSGKMDAMRLPKQAFYTYRVLQNDQPDIHLIGHWTYPEGTRKPVHVISNCEEVELFVNGKSLGKAAPTDRFVFSFPDVTWEPGTIKAIGLNGGKPACEMELETTGEPAAVKLTPITGPGGLQADGSDVALVDVEVVDAKGRRCPTDEGKIDFQIEGPAVWRGGYNSGKPGSINKLFLDTECGINRIAIRSTMQPGKIVLTAKRGGLKSAHLEIESKPVEMTEGLAKQMPQRLPPNP